MKLDNFKNKKVLILGFGREGKDTLGFLRKLFPKKVIGIADQKYKIQNTRYKKIKWHLGKNYLKALENYDVVIKSPGIPAHLPEIEKAFRRGKITSQTQIFLENCSGKIIGVTGTKGKGTTVSLIYKILKEGGLKTYLVGNIEKPALGFLVSAKKEDIYVYEMSCHQLYKISKSPQLAVILNISPAHLDYYKNLKEYIQAKANITLYQNKKDYLIFNPRDKIVRKIAAKSKAKKIRIPVNYEFIGHIRMPLIGKFNLENIMAAITVARLFKIPNKKIIKAIEKFKPLPHRLENVGVFKGIKFYDDSAGTTPESTRQAIMTLGKNVQTIILGGYEGNVNYNDLAKEIIKYKIENLIFFPPSGREMWRTISKLSRNLSPSKKPNCFFVDNMKDAVKLAYRYTQEEKICLLSPACPSFGIFQNYKERGELFKKYVRQNK